MEIEKMSEWELLNLLAARGPDLELAERFSESSGEGGGVYPDEDGSFVKYSRYMTVLQQLAKLVVASDPLVARTLVGPVFKLSKGSPSDSNEYPDAKLVATGPWDLENFSDGTELFLARVDDAVQPLATEPTPLCTICKGFGRYQAGNSGTEADGYAPNIVECDCAPEERHPSQRT